MSSEFFTIIKSLQLFSMGKIGSKTFTSKMLMQGNEVGRNFITILCVNSLLMMHAGLLNAEMNLKSTTSNRFNF